MDQVKQHEVYEKVQEDVCLAVTSKAPIGSRWVDINTGYEPNPDHRSRLVAQQVKYISDEKKRLRGDAPVGGTETSVLYGRYRRSWLYL